MDLGKVKTEDDTKCEIVFKNELVDCRCGELEERSKKAEARCVELELELQKKKSEYELLEDKFRALEVDKLAIEEELKVLKRKSDESKELVDGVEGEMKDSSGRERDVEKIVDLTEENEEEDKVIQLLIENKVLECEKKKAESEVKVWKQRFKELESQVLQLDENSFVRSAEQPLMEGTRIEGIRPRDGSHDGTGLDYMQNNEKVESLVDAGSTFCHSPGKGTVDLQPAGTPFTDLPCKRDVCIEEEKKGVSLEYEVKYARQVRKQLSFEEERSPSKKLAPSTPGVARPASLGIIDISDSDSEVDTSHIQLGTSHAKKIRKNDEEDMDAREENILIFPTPKRKRASNVVNSDTESDDDNVPISKLKRMHLQEKVPEMVGSDLNYCSVTDAISVGDNVMDTITPPRRRLVTLRKCEGKGGAGRNNLSQASEIKYHRGIPTSEDVEDEDSEEAGSESEGESLGGFIVESSDVSHADDASSESQDLSDDNVDFDEILSKLQRNKDHKSEWEFEADMLAAFGKDIELCMKAVCALYRQQTSEEKLSKETFHYNGRGFSKFDAERGSRLAEFLTDGDATGDVKKSVKELQEYDPYAVELCRKLATHYSKQLFEIYKNKEDPLFLSS
ncbi:hypothetical protein CMV_015454 [Castanea mollissima]|uniref:Uncharacterized protein n=1 Tax=Castanea mollissima TaxID=60419 RepID=A0A8J4QUY5_9ROSI|nr:hypothetical protein CMV_015454 [Castanea mollissima]